MNRLDPTLAQPRNHLLNIALSHAEGHVVLGRAAVNDRVNTEEAEHPTSTLLSIKKQSTRPACRSIAELESEFVNVERDRAVQVNNWKVHLIKTVM